MSKAYEMDGVKMDVIKSGVYKGAGIPGTSLDEGQRKMLQDEVVDIHNDFKEAVKSVRSFV
jgi:ClpP class serine protease